MITIKVVFWLFVACRLLPTITISTVPKQNNDESQRRTNRAIPDGLQGRTASNYQPQEVIDNLHYRNAPMDVSHASSLTDTVALDGKYKDSAENSTSNFKVICRACNCANHLDEVCFECCNSTEFRARVSSAIKAEAFLAKDNQEYVVANGEIDSKKREEDANSSIKKHSEIDSDVAMKDVDVSSSHAEVICNACFCENPFDHLCFKLKCCNSTKYDARTEYESSVATSFPNETVVNEDSEINVNNSKMGSNEGVESHSLPSKPATFDSDVSNETGVVSNGSSALFNSWTVIFMCVITLTSLISAFKYAKQWRRDRMREDYLIDGLYSEARPLCLNDVLD